jgi:hypothetical protein
VPVGVFDPRRWNPELRTDAERVLDSLVEDDGREPGEDELFPDVPNRWFMQNPLAYQYTGFTGDFLNMAQSAVLPILNRRDELKFHLNLLRMPSLDPFGPIVRLCIQIHLFNQRIVPRPRGRLTYRRIRDLRQVCESYLVYQIQVLSHRLLYRMLRMGRLGAGRDEFIYCQACEMGLHIN